LPAIINLQFLARLRLSTRPSWVVFGSETAYRVINPVSAPLGGVAVSRFPLDVWLSILAGVMPERAVCGEYRYPVVSMSVAAGGRDAPQCKAFQTSMVWPKVMTLSDGDARRRL
jgi:hypothetical protein